MRPGVAYEVRDGQIHITDAIAYASFLRSQIATHSHEDKRFLRVLSVYEVSNTRFLARRLLLESLGFGESLTLIELLISETGRSEKDRFFQKSKPYSMH